MKALIIIVIALILSACSKEVVTSPTPSTSPIIDNRGILEDQLIKIAYQDYKYSRGFIDDLEDESFAIESWVSISRQFNDDFYIKDYDYSWIEKVNDYYKEDSDAYLHNLNDDGYSIDIKEVLNGLTDTNILYDDIGHFYNDEGSLDIYNAVRYKDSYLKEILNSNISMNETEASKDYKVSRLYNVRFVVDDDKLSHFLTITIYGYDDRTIVEITYNNRANDMPIIEMLFVSDYLIV